MDDVIEKSKKYWRSAGRTGLAHYRAAEIASGRHRKIGIPSVALSTIVATSIFSTLSQNMDMTLRIGTGGCALVAAILAALQAFLSFSERSEKHKAAGARYGGIRRNIDLFQLKFGGVGEDRRDAALERLEGIAAELSSMASDSPSLSESVYSAASAEFDKGHG